MISYLVSISISWRLNILQTAALSCYLNFCLKARACLSLLSCSELTFTAICRWRTRPWSSSVTPGSTWSRRRPPSGGRDTPRTWRLYWRPPGQPPGHHQPVISSRLLGTWLAKVKGSWENDWGMRMKILLLSFRCEAEEGWCRVSERHCKRPRKANFKVRKKYADIWLVAHFR